MPVYVITARCEWCSEVLAITDAQSWNGAARRIGHLVRAFQHNCPEAAP